MTAPASRPPSLGPRSASSFVPLITINLFMTIATWSLPLLVDDLFALWRERTPYWRPAALWRPVPRLAAEVAAVGGLFTSILALRSRISFDFIYFQF